MVEAVVTPRGPYVLALSARSDATRRARGAALSAGLPGGVLGTAWQRRDGAVVIRATGEEGIDRLLRACGRRRPRAVPQALRTRPAAPST